MKSSVRENWKAALYSRTNNTSDWFWHFRWSGRTHHNKSHNTRQRRGESGRRERIPTKFQLHSKNINTTKTIYSFELCDCFAQVNLSSVQHQKWNWNHPMGQCSSCNCLGESDYLTDGQLNPFGTSFKEAVNEATNVYRARHGAPELILDDEVSYDKLKTGSLQPSN